MSTSQQIQPVPLSTDGGDDGVVKVIAGEFRGVKGPAMTFSPVDLWSVEIKTLGKAFELEIAEGHNLVVFVRSGAVRVGAEGQVSSPFKGHVITCLMRASQLDTTNSFSRTHSHELDMSSGARRRRL